MRRDTLLRHGTRLISAFAPACAHSPASTAPRVPFLAPPELPDGYYESEGAVPPGLSRVVEETGSGYSMERVLLPPRLPARPLAEMGAIPLAEDPIELLHFRPASTRAGPHPLILMSPILGNTVFLVDGFARDLAKRGFHAVIVQRKELAFHPEHSLGRAEGEVRLLVLRSRQALDFLVQREDVDASALGTFGISAGGIVSSMVAGADSRLRAHVWMLAGGPLADVMVDTVEERFRGYAREILCISSKTRDELRRELGNVLKTDPLLLAPHVKRDQVLMVLARFDRSVPYRHGLSLWRALGRPERIVCPFGHYTSFVLLPWMRQKVLQHFERRFSPKARQKLDS